VAIASMPTSSPGRLLDGLIHDGVDGPLKMFPKPLMSIVIPLPIELMVAPRLATLLKIATPARSNARFHSITSSARTKINCGTVRPSALAVLRLTTSSNFVGCWTGRSDGLTPLRILPQ
jgi:hypothetical protein